MGPVKKMRALFALVGVAAIDNGRGRTPPMGWRSWNLFGSNVNQTLMESVMDAMVDRSRLVDGEPTSLLDLGYSDVGLDDNWQLCGDYDGYTYHERSLFPVVNRERFWDFEKMTRKAHDLGLTAGWYLNNCICSDTCGDEDCYRGDAAALFEFGFDSVKLDGCGAQTNLDLWASLLDNQIMIENCHWGNTVPNATWCPFNFYRTSGDVRASYESVLKNLNTTWEFASKNLSYPGCWAYPDMLEVGCSDGPGGTADEGLSWEETRTHFSAWAVVSSPLTLSLDVTNATIMDTYWDIIANPDIIAVNQAYYGHSGSPFLVGQLWQYLYKPVDATSTAVLLLNSDTEPRNLTLAFDTVPGLAKSSSYVVRDLFQRKNIGIFNTSYTAVVEAHDVAFLLLSAPH